MTYLQRLKLELNNKPYLTDDEYTELLSEQNLTYDEEYFIAFRPELLKTVLSVFEILSNDVDYFRKIETEFSTTSAAAEALTARIQKVKSQITALEAAENHTDNTFSFMYHGG